MPKQHTRNEIMVGIFVMIGIAALAYLSISIGGLELFPPERYVVKARFASVGDLKDGAPVRIAGVKVGQVKTVHLAEYMAEADLAIGRSIKLPKDTIASIRTEGLLGNTYVALTPGGSLEDLRPGDVVAQTEPAIDLSDLLSRYAFGHKNEPANEDGADGGAKKKTDVFSDPLQ